MKIKIRTLFHKKENDAVKKNEPEIKRENSESGYDPRIESFGEGSAQEKMGEFREKIKRHQKLVKNRNTVIKAVLFMLLFGTGAFLFFHTGTTYITVEKVERNDISGTKYLEFGKYFLKYSPDGISCVDSHSQVLWSTTFTMQTPIVDVCETAVVVAEQQGTQVYVFNQDGLKGQFQTLMPIEKVRVARQGVVAAVLEDEEVTWVNFYESSGTLIAENRTSIGDSGYPLDLDLSPDGLKLAVSYLRAGNDGLSTRIAFYSFDAVGQAQMNNQVGEMVYDNELVPQIIYNDNSTAVAFSTDGFTVFSGKQSVKEKKNVQFDREILSIFYDESRIGFVFASDVPEHKYQMQVYNLNGKRIMQKYFELEYDSISLKKDKIVMFNETEFAIYKLNGQKKFHGKYRKPIENIMDVRGFQKYMILTQDSADLIRLG